MAMWQTLLATLLGGPMTEPAPAPLPGALLDEAAGGGRAARARLGRSLAIREVDAGSCNACELELQALTNPYYDIERFGIRFVASPRHADVLLVTGPVTHNMREALLRTYEAMPRPKWVVAVGDCAVCGGLLADGYACIGAVEKVLPIDLRITGCPPPPIRLLEGLVGLLRPAPLGAESGSAKRW